MYIFKGNLGADMKRLFLAILLLSFVTPWAQAAPNPEETKPSKGAVHHKAHRVKHHPKPHHSHHTGA
jgi:Ni/Co efflux regulator RcnB